MVAKANANRHSNSNAVIPSRVTRGPTNNKTPQKKATKLVVESDELTHVIGSSLTLDSPSSCNDVRVRRLTQSFDDDSASSQEEVPASKPNHAAQYVLAAVVIVAITWVCGWTLLSTDTSYELEHFYSSLQSDVFSRRHAKTGGRLLIYTGVFYLFVGVVTYAFLMRNIRLPGSRWCTKIIRIGGFQTSRLEAIVAGIFLLVQAAALVLRFVPYRPEMEYWPTERTVYEIGSKALGKTCALTLMLLLFPVSKHCFWWDLFNFQFERAIALHRALAWFLVAVTVLHIAISLSTLIMAGEFFHCMWPNEECRKPGAFGISGYLHLSRVYTYGWIAALLMLPLVVTSFQWVRRHRYEWFYYTHFLYLPLLIMLHLHYPELIYYMAPGMSAFVLDKVVWFWSTRRATRVVNMEIPVSSHVRLTLAIDPAYSSTMEPGQWVNVRIPAAHMWQWHPFSIASCPGDNTVTIDIKVLGDWTTRVAKLAETFDAARPDAARTMHTCAFVSPLYGSSHRQGQGYLTHPVVIMISGGIGVTPLLSGLRHIIAEQHRASVDNAGNHQSLYSHVQKVVFVWVVRTRDVMDLYAQELAKYQAMGFLEHGCDVDILIHVTKPDEPPQDDGADGMPSTAVLHHNQGGCHKHKHAKLSPQEAGPLMQYVMGSGHKLILTVLAGCGFLLGLGLANLIVRPYDNQDGMDDNPDNSNSWMIGYVTLLQLVLSLLCSAVAVTLAMSGVVSRPVVPWRSKEEQLMSSQDIEVPMTARRLSSSGKHRHGHRPVLDTLEGFRPDLGAIFEDVSEFCQKRNLSSVGVAVCGPDAMVQNVQDAARDASIARALDFVVDDEHFGW